MGDYIFMCIQKKILLNFVSVNERKVIENQVTILKKNIFMNENRSTLFLKCSPSTTITCCNQRTALKHFPSSYCRMATHLSLIISLNFYSNWGFSWYTSMISRNPSNRSLLSAVQT